MAQYALNLSTELYDEIKRLAKVHDKTARELIISLLKVGLVALEAHDDQNKELYFREVQKDGTSIEKQIIII